jgi:parallel beta-helix repeat protein
MCLTLAEVLRRLYGSRSLGRARKRGGSPQRLLSRLALERLEDRLTPAVHDVTQGTTFATIQAAVDAAVAGDIILADAGIYAENVTVNKSLIIQGAQHGVDARTGRPGAAESILDAATNSGRTLFNITADNVTIDGFTIQNATSVNQFGFGILLGAGTSGADILNNIIQNNIAGLSLANDGAAGQTVIQQNLFLNNNQPGPASGTAIYTDQFNAGGALTNVLIDANAFTGNINAGVVLGSNQAQSQSNITISNNTFTSNGNAVLVGSATGITITRNTMTGSTASQIVIVGDVNGVSITQNFIDNGAGRGVRVLLINTGTNQNITLTSNHIQGNVTAGLDVAAGSYTGLLDARNNWWGSASGPTTPRNPGGTGDAIIDPDNVVIFTPFLGSGVDAEPNTPGFQPTTSTGFSFSFAVSAVDKQVYVQRLDLATRVSSPWTLVAPGQFLSVAVGTYGPAQLPVVFGVGTDNRVYEAKLDASGQLVSGWMLVAPGKFSSIAVGNFGVTNEQPIVFGIGVPAVGQQVYVATFDAQANLVAGWGTFAPGLFLSLTVATYGTGNPEVFGISVDNQAYFARFNVTGAFVDGWTLVAPGQFQSLDAVSTNSGTTELFGIGLNGQAYTAMFGLDGKLLFGWGAANTNQPVNLTQVTAARLANGELVAFGLGADLRAYEATFSATTGAKLTGWTMLSTQLFSELAAGSQTNRTLLYGLGELDDQVYVQLFDAAGIPQVGFGLTAPGTFVDVDVAQQS